MNDASCSAQSSSETIGRLQAVPVLMKLLSNEDANCVTAALATISALAADVADNKRVCASPTLGVADDFADIFASGGIWH